MTLIPHPPLLQLCGISKHFGAVQALVDVNFEVCDRIVVLRLGRTAGAFDAHTTSLDQIVAAITGEKWNAEAALRAKRQAGILS